MKKIISIFSLFLSTIVCSQDFPSGLHVVEFNASFNKTNEVSWLSKLTDCETERVDITSDSRWAGEYKIVVVPTLVVFISSKYFNANGIYKKRGTRLNR